MGQHYTKLLYFSKKRARDLIENLQHNIPVEKHPNLNIDFNKFEGTYPYLSKCGIWLKEDPVIIDTLATRLFFDITANPHLYSSDLVAYLSSLKYPNGITIAQNLIKEKDSLLAEYLQKRHRCQQQLFVDGFNIDLHFFEDILSIEIEAGWKSCNNIIASSPSFKKFYSELLEKYNGIYAVVDNDSAEKLTILWSRGAEVNWDMDAFDLIHLNEENKPYDEKIFDMANEIADIKIKYNL
ncbi:hypothetical protein [Candidatus Uabimicrobium sp. HlEnr_7]|uniref:hypothetical protein n=1 Tax=Candidatus Uabimicrobium helgolandensis TaxID=3095367 RepID=UPI003555FE22